MLTDSSRIRVSLVMLFICTFALVGLGGSAGAVNAQQERTCQIFSIEAIDLDTTKAKTRSIKEPEPTLQATPGSKISLYAKRLTEPVNSVSWKVEELDKNRKVTADRTAQLGPGNGVQIATFDITIDKPGLYRFTASCPSDTTGLSILVLIGTEDDIGEACFWIVKIKTVEVKAPENDLSENKPKKYWIIRSYLGHSVSAKFVVNLEEFVKNVLQTTGPGKDVIGSATERTTFSIKFLTDVPNCDADIKTDATGSVVASGTAAFQPLFSAAVAASKAKTEATGDITYSAEASAKRGGIGAGVSLSKDGIGVSLNFDDTSPGTTSHDDHKSAKNGKLNEFDFSLTNTTAVESYVEYANSDRDTATSAAATAIVNNDIEINGKPRINAESTAKCRNCRKLEIRIKSKDGRLEQSTMTIGDKKFTLKPPTDGRENWDIVPRRD